MNKIKLKFGDVRKKQITTRNHFISHMVEHIAWRLGMEIELSREDENWEELGKALGEEIAKNETFNNSGVAIGMIDDGSAEVRAELGAAKFKITSTDNVDLDWFLKLRCEQLNSGAPLVELGEGLAQGLNCKISINVCNLEDQHHTWEGIYRGIGIALSKIFTPASEAYTEKDEIQKVNLFGEVSILELSSYYAAVSRGTAETGVRVGVDFSKTRPNSFVFNVDQSINVEKINELLELLAEQAGCTLQIDFTAEVLSSSHVVMEDIGLVLGRAFLEIFKLQMEKSGINGAGSSLQTIEDLDSQAIRVGISVEGRKFWRYIPFKDDYKTIQQKLLVGNNVLETLRSEDLDDFIDGFTGGMLASVAVHIKELSDPTEAWQQIFIGLGVALKEVFSPNQYRKGVPSGVKAMLG